MFSGSIGYVGLALIVTGLLLLFSEYYKAKEGELTPLKALVIGISQAIAIIPGISRSGSTISTALILGVDRSEAARFSFLMVVPIILGKIFLDLIKGDITSTMPKFNLLVIGFVAAFIAGMIACKWMIVLVKKAQLNGFAYYCLIVGTAASLYAFT